MTVEKTACGGAPESGDRRVRLEEVGHDLCALHLQEVTIEPVSEASKGAECQRLLTERNPACGGALELLERRVGLECLGEVLGALHNGVAAETVSAGVNSEC